MELFLPEEYPMAPPKVRFLMKIYHPNIGVLVLSHTFSNLVNSYNPKDKLGRICLDILKGQCAILQRVENGVFIVLCRQMVACPAD